MHVHATAKPAGCMKSASIIQRRISSRSSPRHASVTVRADKLISKVEIPAFIPRDGTYSLRDSGIRRCPCLPTRSLARPLDPDISDQLLRWAVIDVQDQGVANCGCPCQVEPYYVEEMLMGFTVTFMASGEEPVQVRVAFDAEKAQKHEWVGRGENGMPTLEGNVEDVEGKNLAVTKLGETPVSDVTKGSIRAFCEQLMSSINKYYAFGSCFVDDAQ